MQKGQDTNKGKVNKDVIRPNIKNQFRSQRGDDQVTLGSNEVQNQ